LGTPNPAIDWEGSYPGATPGFAVATGTTTPPVLLDFVGTPLIGVSADKVLMQISDFIHISGSFAFKLGPVEEVDVRTGISSAVQALVTEPGLATITSVDDTEAGASSGLARTSDYSMLWNLRVNTIQVGASGVSVFVGYAPGLTSWDLAADADGILSKSELEGLGGTPPVGFFMGNLNLGLVLMTAAPLSGAQAVLNGRLPTFLALRSTVDDLDLVGIDFFTIDVDGVSVNVNLGSQWKGAPTVVIPSVDFVSSFPDTDGACTSPPSGAGCEDAVGMEIATGTTTEPILIDFDGFLISASVEHFSIAIAEFV
jgi:hypothetical protein